MVGSVVDRRSDLGKLLEVFAFSWEIFLVLVPTCE